MADSWTLFLTREVCYVDRVGLKLREPAHVKHKPPDGSYAHKCSQTTDYQEMKKSYFHSLGDLDLSLSLLLYSDLVPLF